MSEEKGVRWLCHRCVKKLEATVEPDPAIVRVCDGCQIENYTRPESGSVAVVEPVLEAETVEEPEPEPEPSEKEIKIAALEAQLAELKE
ncbi:MAG: hypothetical protein ACYSUV_17240 [Planctomycetota bacterium]|jgi:hypothetical protein